MRSIDATLQAALESGSYTPYFLVTIQDKYTGYVHASLPTVGYKLNDLDLTFTIQMPAFLDVPYYRTAVVLSRGVTIAGTNYTEETSDFVIIDSSWDGNFQTFNCNLIPRSKYSIRADITYRDLITAFCAHFDKTPVFLDPAAAWLDYQFYPYGRWLTLNDARLFFTTLRQKYFIFATDNGNNEILFYTAFTHVANHQYDIPGYHFSVDYNVGWKIQYLWRDENETTHQTSPRFDSMGQLDPAIHSVVSMCDLGSGRVLAGTTLWQNGRIFRSIDYGEHWDAGFSITGLNALYYSVNGFLSPAPGIVLAFGGYLGYILRSVDYGVTWSMVAELGNDFSTSPVDLGNGVLLCGHSSAGGGCQVYKSTDYGLSWHVTQALGTETAIYSLAHIGNGVCVAGTGNNGAVYRSTNSGDTWAKVQNLYLTSLVLCLLPLENGVCLAGGGTNGILFKSTDAGATWAQYFQIADGYVNSLSTLGNGILLLGSSPSGLVYRSLDDGLNWVELQQLGAETSVQCFASLGNGSTLAGTANGGYIFKSLNCSADQDPIHNLGFLPSTAVEPSAYFQLAPAKFDPFPVNLKYQSSDYIRIDLIQGGIYEITCAQVSELLDLSKAAMPWQMQIIPTQWLSNTAVGALPGTIERVAPYTPLNTANFNKNLDASVNNLQAFADRVDDLVLGGIADAPVDGTPYLRKDAAWLGLTPAGTVYVPLATPLTSTSWDGDAHSTTAKTLIDLSAVFGAPAGIKAVLIKITAKDSGSAAGSGLFFGLAPSATAGQTNIVVRLDSMPNSKYADDNGICPCDANGDIYFQIGASGANTLSAYIEIWGYWVVADAVILPGTGLPEAPADGKGYIRKDTAWVSGREKLTTVRTYYVRTDGSDSNTGLINSSGGAFLTIQKALNVVAEIDIGVYNVNIQLGTGTWTDSLSVLAPFISGGGVVTISGDVAAPGSYIIDAWSGIHVAYGATLCLSGIKLCNGSGAIGAWASENGIIYFTGACEFGTSAWVHLYATTGGRILLGAIYTISGGAGAHMQAESGGSIKNGGLAVTLTGTPNWGSAFAAATREGLIESVGASYTGSALGKRYDVSENGTIFTNGGGATLFPGSTSGTVASGGVYDTTTQFTLLSAYPVGSVYLSVLSTSPAVLFGGVWSAIGTGRVLVGIDTGDTDFDTVEKTGGTKTVAASAQAFVGSAGQVTAAANTGATGSGATANTLTLKAHTLTPAGTNTPGAATSVVQPYFVVYMWKRTS